MAYKRAGIGIFVIVLTLLYGCATSGMPQKGSARESVSAPRKVERRIYDGKLDVVKLVDEKGNVYPLANLGKGRPILVDFSASWCKPCGKLTKILNQLKLMYPQVKFIMIIPNEDSPEAFDVKPNYPVYKLYSYPLRYPWKREPVYPETVLFDEEGEIVGTVQGLAPKLFYVSLISNVLQ